MKLNTGPDLGALPLSEMDPADNPTTDRPERLRSVGAGGGVGWGGGGVVITGAGDKESPTLARLADVSAICPGRCTCLCVCVCDRGYHYLCNSLSPHCKPPPPTTPPTLMLLGHVCVVSPSPDTERRLVGCGATLGAPGAAAPADTPQLCHAAATSCRQPPLPHYSHPPPAAYRGHLQPD